MERGTERDEPNDPIALRVPRLLDDPQLGLRPYFSTITYPGGLKAAQLLRWERWIDSDALAPKYWLYVLEGGDDDSAKHLHLHTVFWFSDQRRTDSVSRTLRSIVFERAELDEVSSLRHLLVTRACTDVRGAIRYVLKDHLDGTGIHHRLIDGDHIDDYVQEARTYWETVQANKVAGDSCFPEPGKVKTVPPSQVPDFLYKAGLELNLGFGHSRAFSELVANCYGRGIRFDLRNLRSYRLGVELIAATGGGSEPSVYLLGELESAASSR